MKTLERKFSSSERIIAKAKFSAWVYVSPVIVAMVLGGIIAVLWIFGAKIEGLFGVKNAPKYLTEQNMRWALLGAAGVVLICTLIVTLKLYSKELIVTEDKIVYREGIASVHNVVIPLKEVRILESHQTGFQRICGIGTITIISDAEKPYNIKGIKSAERFSRRIIRQMSEVRRAQESTKFILKLN